MRIADGLLQIGQSIIVIQTAVQQQNGRIRYCNVGYVDRLVVREVYFDFRALEPNADRDDRRNRKDDDQAGNPVSHDVMFRIVRRNRFRHSWENFTLPSHNCNEIYDY